MRCLVRLEADKDQAYDAAYHAQLQGAIYRLLEQSGHDDIHDLSPFKFLTFSNVFPPKDMEEGDSRTLLIASPNKPLIEDVAEQIEDTQRIEPGGRQFRVTDVSTFNINPEQQGTMITGTPIVVRLAPPAAEEYGIDPQDYDDVYWRLDHPSQAFIDAIEDNLAHKYETYYDREAPERPYFTSYTSRKQVSVPLQYEGQDIIVIGTTWELDYECRDRALFRLIKLAYDTGVGELNTSGFGFMNKVGD